MRDQNDICLFHTIEKEVIRILIERIQGDRTRRLTKTDQEEAITPKTTYEVEEILNQPYMNRDEVPLAMDIFKPVVPEETELPVIVVIHGGGLVVGDRTIARRYVRSLARRGYLVFSVEYRLAPRANACEQLDDVCAGLDLVGLKLLEYNIDFTRMFLTAESAGVFLAIYVAAMKRSKKLQEAIGYKPTTMTFKALGLHSGMFYTNRDDPIGWFLRDQFFGEKVTDDNFYQYLDPEHEEILTNLPPVFLTTAKGDFLNNYTIMYHNALKKAGIRTRLKYYGDESLGHAFPCTATHLPASADAIDRMCDWFEEQAQLWVEENERQKEEQKVLNELNSRIESGEITEQKTWKFIRDLNSYSKNALNKTAMIDGSREYTYRQLFRKWERYAEVFSALGMTDENHTRVGLMGTPAVETTAALYGLNMTGASVSMLFFKDANYEERWKEMVRKEGLTDLILTDIRLEEKILKRILKEKNELGIRNIILLHVPVDEPLATQREKAASERNYRIIKKIPGVILMDDLLSQYDGWPIHYGEDGSKEDALIIHTSGTVSGIHKPIPLSDRAFNESVARLLRDKRFASLRGRARSFLEMDLSSSYGLIDALQLVLAFGGTVIVCPMGGFSPIMIGLFRKYKPNVIFIGGLVLDIWSRFPIPVDLSSLELVFLGGAFISSDAKKRYDRFLKDHGSKVRASIGYGISEAGAACFIASPDREDNAIGYPLPGVNVRIYDEAEDRYYTLEDGVRTGVLFLSTPSLSSGRIDDQVFFELTEIDGEKYLNTYDLVHVNEDGSLTYAGRMDRYFVNNEGVRFDAGLVETALSSQPGMGDCAIAPGYDKTLHDTIPILYVQKKDSVPRSIDMVRKALINVFIKEDKNKESNLPSRCVVMDQIPYNQSGKVDVHRIINENLDGSIFLIEPVRRDGILLDIRLSPYKYIPGNNRSIPEELQKDFTIDGIDPFSGTRILDQNPMQAAEMDPILGFLSNFFCL